MGYNLGEFNREGQVSDTVGETDMERRERVAAEAAVQVDDETDTRSEEELLDAADQRHEAIVGEADLETETAAEVTGEEAASDSDAADEAEVNDVDGDGHDDDNGQFVAGNQEAAASEDTVDDGEPA